MLEKYAVKHRDRILELYSVLRGNRRILETVNQYGFVGNYFHFVFVAEANRIQQITGIIRESTKYPYNILSIETESKVA